MTPIPAEAMPVVEILRRDVPRPRELPTSRTLAPTNDHLRWYGGRSPNRWTSRCCPMGLHPAAGLPTPRCDDEFPASSLAIFAFAEWWDSLEDADAVAAVEAVWGPEA